MNEHATATVPLLELQATLDEYAANGWMLHTAALTTEISCSGNVEWPDREYKAWRLIFYRPLPCTS